MQCPECALKCNKSVQLPAWLSYVFWVSFGDLSAIWAGSALSDFPLIEEGKVGNLVSTSCSYDSSRWKPRPFRTTLVFPPDSSSLNNFQIFRCPLDWFHRILLAATNREFVARRPNLLPTLIQFRTMRGGARENMTNKKIWFTCGEQASIKTITDYYRDVLTATPVEWVPQVCLNHISQTVPLTRSNSLWPHPLPHQPLQATRRWQALICEQAKVNKKSMCWCERLERQGNQFTRQFFCFSGYYSEPRNLQIKLFALLDILFLEK